MRIRLTGKHLRTHASFLLGGDGLDLAEITELMGITPHSALKNGQRVVPPDFRPRKPPPTGFFSAQDGRLGDRIQGDVVYGDHRYRGSGSGRRPRA